MNNFDIISNYLSLLSIKGISHKTVVNLVRNLNTLGNIFKVEGKFLKEAGLTDLQIDFIKSNKIDYKFVEQELELIKKYKINIITFEDENYPNLLKSIDDPPAILYTYGNIEALKQPSIAIVGSREASIPGCRFAKQLASDLAEIGFNIVSGFATGIDIHAHLGAMEKGLTTAIFGSGLLYVYPASNKKYLKKLYENGCIVSEQPLKEEPNAHNFPRRNRIISGLSLGVVVVEAHVKSGSLITAKLAVEYGRDIFAVPIFPDHQNTGTNKLIKEGAKLIENYMDIVSEYPNLFNKPKNIDKTDNNIIISQSDNVTKILEILRNSPNSIDELCIKTELSPSEVISIVAELELNDLIYLNNEGKYTINRR